MPSVLLKNPSSPSNVASTTIASLFKAFNVGIILSPEEKVTFSPFGLAIKISPLIAGALAIGAFFGRNTP